MSLRKTSLAVALMLSLAPLSGVAAEDPAAVNPAPAVPSAQSAQDPTPTLQVYSREIAVDVLVTDAKGRPVYGLDASDFTIEEDGKPQPARSFKEYGAPASAAAPQAGSAANPDTLLSAPPRLPANVYSNFGATPASGPVNIVLLDTLSSSPPLVDYAEEQTNEYIRTMPEGTQMAVFWLSGGGLHMLQGFTSDRDLLLQATRTDRTDFGINDDFWTSRWLTIDALNQIAAYVANIKGRKNLLWFTPSMSVTLMRDGGSSWSAGTKEGALFGGSRESGDRGIAHRLMDTYDLYAAEQIAVCPIDPHGVRPGPHGLGIAQLRMQAVAEQTGGIAYYNSNDLRAGIAQAIQDGSHSYTLTYVPPNDKNDGKFHKITIKLDRPGLHLVYRSGYNAEQPAQHAPPVGAALLTASMEGKVPAATQVLFDARVQPAATPSPIQPAPYDILFAVPQKEIAFSDGPNGTHTAALQFALSAYDIDGTLVTRLDQNVTLNLTADQYRQFMKNPLRFHEQVKLPPGQLALRLGVLDTVSNQAGTLEIPVFNWETRAQAKAAHSVVRLHDK